MRQLTPGSLLVAPPKLKDPRFTNTVVLLCHNSSTGSFGLVLNEPARFNLADISEEIGLERPLNHDLFWGGPVNQGSIWMVHSSEWGIDDITMEVDDRWSITSSDAMFEAIQEGDTPREFRFVHGFSSWGPGQLEAELDGQPPYTASSSWLTAPSQPPDILFNLPIETMWENTCSISRSQAVGEWL